MSERSMVVALLAIGCAPTPLSFDYRGLLELERLAEDRADRASAHLVSSFDPTGGNMDWRAPESLPRLGARYVLFDQPGPAVLTRIWMTHESVLLGALGGEALTRLDATISFTFDDEPAPRVEMPVARFFSGDEPPFSSPFVADPDHSSGGFISYLPMPFRERLVITVDQPVPFFQFGLYRPLDGAELDSFDPEQIDEELRAKAERLWGGRGPFTTEKTIEQRTRIELMPGGEGALFTEGSGVAVAVEVRIDPQPGFAAPLRMIIDVDGGPAEVDVPFGAFFLTPLEPATAEGRAIGHTSDGLYYSYFPMPYREGLELRLKNGGDQPFAVEAMVRTIDGDADDLLVFHAETSSRALEPGDPDYLVAELEGRGHLAGTSMVLCCRGECGYGLAPRFGHLEGDERITVDGAAEPAIHGTGSEDYFNSGYYYAGGTYHRPTHGMPYRFEQGMLDNGAFDCTTQYRLHLSDPIPFRRSLRFTLEHGPLSDFSTWFESTVYFYANSSAALR